MAFPGGQRDPGDSDLLATAIRETHEEIGLNMAESAKLLGVLDSVQAVAGGRRIGMRVMPFVFELVEEPPLRLNEEVAEVIWAPLAPLARGELSTTMPYRYQGTDLELPAWQVEGRIVWGLTYRMLETLLTLTVPRK
jgi:8-oxo-dGTP pyrophosphatase MutT (NUDIX family)